MHYENLVFGATMESLLFSIEKGYPLIYLSARKPSLIDEESEKWARAYFILSLSGLVKFSNKVRSAKLTEKQLRVTTSNKTFEITFEDLWVFDDEGLAGLPEPTGRTNDEYLVMDWMIIKRGSDIPHEELLTGEKLAEKINFFPKPKNQNPKYKDLVASSIMTKRQLDSQEYSELFCRFHVEDVLEYTLGKEIRLESEKREVFPRGRYVYPEMKSIHFHPPVETREMKSGQAYLAYLLENLQ